MAETREVPQKRNGGNGGNGGTKAAALVSAIAATALGVFAGFSQYVTPLRQDFVVLREQTERRFINMEKNFKEKILPLQEHAVKNGHPDSTISQLAAVEKEIENLKSDIIRHAALKGHPTLVSNVKSIDEKLKEVETQFRWGSDVRDREIAHITDRLANLEADNKKTIAHMASDLQKTKENNLVLAQLWEAVFNKGKESVAAQK